MFRRLLVAFGLLGLCLPAVAQDRPQLPATVELLSARPFSLQEPIPVLGRPDLERSGQGWLLVLAADPTLTRPIQLAQPVLHAGATLAGRANHGWPSGRLVVVVLGGEDLSKTPIWFGEPDLPERATPDSLSAALEAAEREGIRPFTQEQIARALAAGGEALELEDVSGLWAPIEALLDEHDPDRPGVRR